MNNVVLGIDIGGSHITASMVDLDTRDVVAGSWRRTRVNSAGTAESIIREWCVVITELFDIYKPAQKKLALAMPGPFDYQAGISLMKNQQKYDALFGLNVKELLSAACKVPVENIHMINDAACFLQGEVFGGAAHGFTRAIGLTLGTGLGSSRVLDGVAEDADLWKTPFKDSIAEDYISTRWFVKHYFELTGKTVKDVKELSELLPDPKAQDVFNEFGTNLGIFLASFIRMDKPDIVILGGNIANALPLFEKSLKEELSRNKIALPIKCATLGEKSAIIGAASSWSK
ncbi:glucokinase [Chitinophaga costaii]|uniref:Glucokinase n=1 Tax=Chitinophaga costaii TaxID=1335309 RepID=A0A1C4CAF4_9BACT|nr:ROK family protein [Chitinophaga costaii]PUZ27172.1 ROK family protein [Chitinophaga costaii]SCC15964.1 glucokinase [Chitinophaga costaii]